MESAVLYATVQCIETTKICPEVFVSSCLMLISQLHLSTVAFQVLRVIQTTTRPRAKFDLLRFTEFSIFTVKPASHGSVPSFVLRHVKFRPKFGWADGRDSSHSRLPAHPNFGRILRTILRAVVQNSEPTRGKSL